MIQALMRARRGGCGMAVGEHDERRAIELRAGDAVHDRRCARTERRQARARWPCDLRLRDRRNGAAGLRGREHERQTRAAAASIRSRLLPPPGMPKMRLHTRLAEAQHDPIGDPSIMSQVCVIGIGCRIRWHNGVVEPHQDLRNGGPRSLQGVSRQLLARAGRQRAYPEAFVAGADRGRVISRR